MKRIGLNIIVDLLNGIMLIGNQKGGAKESSIYSSREK